MYNKTYCENFVKGKINKVENAIKEVENDFSEMDFDNMADKIKFEEDIIKPLVMDLESYKDKLASLSFK